MNTYKLLTPGPLTTTESVKKEMLFDHCTWDDDYKKITQKIREELLDLAHADRNLYTVVLMQGSGTFGVESVLSSVIGDNDKLLIAANGAYGERMEDIAKHQRIPYMIYNTFGAVMDWVSDGIENLTSFMGAFCPLYFLAVSIARGSVTASAFYQAVLFLIYLVEMIIGKIVLPSIHIYIMVKVLNFLSEEKYLNRLSELLEIAISWILKTVLALVVGLNIVQGLISPAVDMVKRSTLTRSAEAIPGIGDAIGGVTEVVLGTAVLVKNGIGMTGAIICVSLCLIPIVEIGCIVLMYKLTAALLEPVSNERVIGCIESVSEGGRLLIKVVFTVGLLFLVTIVIVSAVTGNV